MEQVVMETQRREELGSGPAGRMRKQGLVPGVVYGLDRESIAIAVPREGLAAALRTEQRLNVLLDLRIEGIRATRQTAVIVKAIQRHPVTRAPLSVDFQWISLTELITVHIPIHVQGEAPGVSQEGGVVDQILHEIEVKCLPTDIPDYLVADITGLGINDTLHVAALQAPADVEILADPADPVINIAPPIREEDLAARVDETMLEGLEEVPLEEPGEAAPAEPESE